MNEWFNIIINYTDLLEFNFDNNKLRSNINRQNF